MAKIKRDNVEGIAKKGFATKRFIIRPLEPRDFLAWSNAYDSMFPKQHEFDEEKPKDLSRKGFRQLLRKSKDFRRRRIIYAYGVFEKKTGRLMGNLWLSLLHAFGAKRARFADSTGPLTDVLGSPS